METTIMGYIGIIANFVKPFRKLNIMLSDIERKAFFPDARPSADITAELKGLDEPTEEFERMMGGENEAAHVA